MDRKIQSIELEKTVEDIERSIELKQSDRHEKNYIHPPRTQIYIINVNFSTVVIKNVDQKEETYLISACLRNPTVASSPASQKFQVLNLSGS